MRIFLILTTLLPGAVLAQSEVKQRRIESVALALLPEYGFRTLNYTSSHAWVQDRRDQSEVANSGYTAGIKVKLRSAHKLSFETGLQFANKSFKTKTEQLTWSSDDPGLPHTAKTVFRLKYLSLPLHGLIELAGSDRLTLYAKVGLSTHLFLSAKTKVIMGYEDGREAAHSSVKQAGRARFSMAGLIGTTLDYRLSNSFIVSVEPCYQRFLTSTNADDNAKEFLYSFGIGTGLKYVL